MGEQAFVRVEARAGSESGLETWTGWVESQLRKIIPKVRAPECGEGCG